jgi:radical SAM protein with 4Fe4S-binding SPASM domain
MVFYADAIDHIVAFNRLGHDFVERTAALIMAKVLGGHEPNFLDLRSPCGAGIGQVAYGHDGGLYTCDEGRMVGRAGDDCFRLGHVAETPYRDAIAGPVVRATVLASVLEGQPHCSTCAYKPWCGVCPVHNYCEQGSLHGRMAESSWCRLRMGVFDLLLGRLRRADAFERGLFERWATPRALDHFVRERAA